jgi:hypothetical protein
VLRCPDEPDSLAHANRGPHAARCMEPQFHRPHTPRPPHTLVHKRPSGLTSDFMTIGRESGNTQSRSAAPRGDAECGHPASDPVVPVAVLVEEGVVEDQQDYQTTVAYQGAFAYVYLADRSTCPREGDRCDWSRPPRLEEDVLPVARVR